MKALLLTTALAAGFALPSAAQDAPSPFQSEAMGPAVHASDVIGARIYASEAELDADAYDGVQEGWNDIGEVNDIVLGRDGSVDAVLVDIGGFLGMGERKIAVDMAALRFVQDDATDADDWFLVLRSDRAALEAAPEWMMPGAADQAADAAATDAATGDQAATGDPVATDETEQVASDGTATTPDRTGLPDGYTEVTREELTSEMLTGANVHDPSDASIAEVSDLVLTAEGQVTDVILDVGGFLGIGTRSVAIPMERLTVARTEAGDVTLWVDMTREELEALPEHKM